MISLICPICQKRFQRFPSQVKISHERGGTKLFCSAKCMGKDPDRKQRMRNLGKKSGSWTKGRRRTDTQGFCITSTGYKGIFMPTHPCSSKRGYVMEHRLVMEKFIGRYLCPEEKVHHKNMNRLDNRIENLELCANQSEHVKKHKGVRGKFESNIA